jgi:N-acyl-D-amino-acid deacylase
MASARNGLTRRDALVGLAGLGGMAAAQVGGIAGSAAAEATQQPPPVVEAIPVKGKAGPGLEALDVAMIQIMERHGIPGAAVAIAKDGRLVYAKSFGWANVGTGETAQPETLFALASCSKAFTAVATLILVDQGKLRLDDKVFEILKNIEPPVGAKVDPRLASITVRQCLNHSGGWDRGISGDPANWQPQMCRAFRQQPPISSKQFISFMRAVPLNFDPGTDMKYSNVGFVIMGEVIAKVSGQSYSQFVQDNVLKPVGIKRAGLHGFDGKYVEGEAVRHLAGTELALPPLHLPMLDATGGWSATAVDMVRFLTNLDGSRGKPVLTENARKAMMEPPPKPLKPRDDGTWYGLGWDAVLINDKGSTWFKSGSYQGMRTYIKRNLAGVNWALLYNASMEIDPTDIQIVANSISEVRQVVDGIKKHPDVDLFKEFP